MYNSDDAICHYDKKFNSNKLIVTIGESWTWGDSLDPQLRLQEVYGKHLSDSFKCDWLNIARKGASNFWIFYQIAELVRYGNIPYNKLLIVFCCTEAGREFSEQWSWHKYDPTQNLKSFNNFDECIHDYNAGLVRYLKTQIDKLKWIVPTVDVVISHNFCNASFWQHDIPQIEDNWVKINALHNDKHIAFNVPTIGNFKYFRKHCSDVESIIDYQEQAIELVNFLLASPLHHKKASKHPTNVSHQLWANYLHTQIIKISDK